jgi:hypothetical protein
MSSPNPTLFQSLYRGRASKPRNTWQSQCSSDVSISLQSTCLETCILQKSLKFLNRFQSLRSARASRLYQKPELVFHPEVSISSQSTRLETSVENSFDVSPANRRFQSLCRARASRPTPIFQDIFPHRYVSISSQSTCLETASIRARGILQNLVFQSLRRKRISGSILNGFDPRDIYKFQFLFRTRASRLVS